MEKEMAKAAKSSKKDTVGAALDSLGNPIAPEVATPSLANAQGDSLQKPSKTEKKIEKTRAELAEVDAEIARRKQENITGSGGLGLITGRFNLEGPIIKDKLSFIGGLRSTYSNWILKRIHYNNVDKSKGSFQDYHVRLSYHINKNNSIFVTAYQSNDFFQFSENTLYRYNNLAVSAKFRHSFNNKLNSILSYSYSSYNYNITGDENTPGGYKHEYGIDQLNIKTDFNYYLNSSNAFSFGISSIKYGLQPGSKKALGDESVLRSN
ncbi:MAG: DUF4398 domain-containing protein [Bacteroidales bacterium]|nr:DUF4398 domain-containing protein [Bacteroidales bacterium]